MKYWFTNVFVYIFLLISSVLFGQDFYRSNSIGMVFEKISSFRLDDYDWTIKISGDGSAELRSLYHRGDEVKKLEYIREGSNLTINEYVSDGLVHMEHIENGLILFEKYFNDNGIIGKYEYEWNNDRQIYRIVYTENEHLVYTDVFVIDVKGRLQQIRRLYDTGNQQLAGFSYTNDVVTTGWYGKNKDFLLYRYSNGKIVEIDTWSSGVLSSTVKFIFSESGKTVIDNDIIIDKTTVKIYDSSENILSEEIRNGNSYEKTIFSYDNNLLIQKKISSSGLRKEYNYEYYDDKSLKLEKVLKDNMLFKEIFYENEDKTKEKIYKNGNLVLIITYENEVKINEEYIQ